MSPSALSRKFSRRQALKIGGTAAVAAVGGSLLPRWAGRYLSPVGRRLGRGVTPTVFRHLAATDGWVSTSRAR